MGGEFANVAIDPEVERRCVGGFTFHDATFVRVEFSPDADPVLVFDASFTTEEGHQSVRVKAIPVEARFLKVTLPEDWVSDLDVVPLKSGYEYRWIDQDTGKPMAKARATRLEVTLAD